MLLETRNFCPDSLLAGIVWALACVVYAPPAHTGQATSPPLMVKAVAEVETRVTQGGRDVVKLAPADRLVPGDQVIYTLEIRNKGPAAVRSPSVVFPIPAHMVYLADTASGPGAQVTFSVDGGRTFERPESLRPAKPMDYTHIRWVLKNDLKAKSVAFARFRAAVK